MKLTRALFASLLSAALLGVAVAADIHRRHQHTSRYTNDNTTILTNGERLARGLPPKPPTRRWASGTSTSIG
ncbi:hypothetical protein DFP72DRAFT_924111 [Ephemerocybe angulata]|uniref:Uncharacterized protein n=1 Tax=Ephemerocybe angulata TaxID=980116 RepID=A0A8H6LX20_9AGAR|nr:hypothetical protein DFP72DRAFT_924111 [Tulosesus angulatus]